MRVLAPIALVAVLVAPLGACGPRHDTKDNGPTPTPSAEPGPRAIQGTSIEDLPDTDAALSNLPEIISSLGLAPYYQRGHHGQGLTVAVLDNGFAGLSASRGVRLPPDIKVEDAPRPDMLPTNHGTKLAEIVYALASGDTKYSVDKPGPKMLLFNSNGFTNFKDAAAKVAASNVDVVLYAQIWEYGGNGDGAGFINNEVKAALDKGVLWVNAAGNLGRATYGSTIAEIDGNVTLPHAERYVRLAVSQSGTPVKIVLTWNDFDDSKDYRTPQDLDLVLETEGKEEIATSRLVQSGDDGTDKRNYSAHAREIIQTTLNSGVYYLRVEAVSRNFDADSRLRLTADGEGVRFLDKGDDDHVVLMPADNARVLAIGASDVGYTSRAARSKPELDVVSSVSFEGGATHQGTSAASAIAAGALTVFQSAYGRLDHDGVVLAAKRGLLAQPKADCAAAATATAGACSTPLLKLLDPSRL